MNLLLEGLSFCNPFFRRKQDENLQTNSKTHGSNKHVNCTEKNNYKIVKPSMKSKITNPVETDSDSSEDPKQKIYFKDDNFLILQPDYVNYSREEDDASGHSNVKTFPFHVHKKASMCEILDNEPDFEEIMERICRKRLMSGEECGCPRCRTFNVIKESLKHPGTFSWGNKYPDNLGSDRSDHLQNTKKSVKHDAALLRIEIALHDLMEKLGHLEKMAACKNETTKLQSDLCTTYTQYSTQKINIDDSCGRSFQVKHTTKIPNYKFKNNDSLSQYCHKTWAYKNDTEAKKQCTTFLPRVKEVNLETTRNSKKNKLPRALKRK